MSAYTEPSSWIDLLQVLSVMCVPASLLLTARHLNRRGERFDAHHRPSGRPR